MLIWNLVVAAIGVVLIAVVIKACFAEPQAFNPNNTGSARILTEEEAKVLDAAKLMPPRDNNEWFIDQVPESKIYLECRPEEDSNVKTSWTAKNVYIDLDFLSEVLESGQYTREQLTALRDRIDKYLAQETLCVGK